MKFNINITKRILFCALLGIFFIYFSYFFCCVENQPFRATFSPSPTTLSLSDKPGLVMDVSWSS